MIIDSDVLINASRSNINAVDFLISSGNTETLYVSVISYLELQTGARDKAELRLSHGLALPDAIIAATALESQEILATSNTKDFVFISGPRLIAP